MALAHPNLAKFTCEDCGKWIYDFRKGEPIIRRATGEAQARAPGQPTPCRTCPRGSPEQAKALRLPRPQLITISLYAAVRATNGAILTDAERADPILARTLAIIDSVWRHYDSAIAAGNFATVLTDFRQKYPAPNPSRRRRGQYERRIQEC